MSIWGCCALGDQCKDSFIICQKCKKIYHFACMSLDESSFTLETRELWFCPECVIPKVSISDSTPIRNVSVSRGNKRPALNSPPSTGSITRDDIREIVENVFKTNLTEIISKFSETISSTLTQEIKPLREEILILKESIGLINTDCNSLKLENEDIKLKVQNLESINEKLSKSLSDMHVRLNQAELQLRLNNLELQCVPEQKNENLLDIFTNLSKTIGCKIDVNEITHCTRVAKINKTSTRPRSIIYQLTSRKSRDSILAGALNFNKKNPHNKLNSSDLGVTGSKTPVFISEHLSPTVKSLHAAVRLRAKEKNFKFVWIRNGKIFVRKNEETDFLVIRNFDMLENIE
ncbi:unnamed protein product [Leptosia nina]|uniref:Zinc finger PHD-type domain-containing protein n=1 Tax=Leptosia nina TaxID=320188 RepID=A0AAV1JJS3_9NEOP